MEVLTAVGDDHVIEELDVEPDPDQGPAASSSMMAGPISETIGHSGEDEGEIVRVSPQASKALEYDELQAARQKKAKAASAGTKATARAKASPKPAAKAKTAKPAEKPAQTGPAKAPAGKPAAEPKKLSNTLAAPRGGTPDKLILIKGIGPVNERKLNEHGIYHFDQIAAWKKADIQAAEAYLAFDGRIAREDWIGQAKALAKATKPAAKGGRRK